MTKQEFESAFAKQLHITVAELHNRGLVGVLCDCECMEGLHWRIDDTDSKVKQGGPLGDGDYYPSREKIMRNNPAR